jgi:NTE family protein
VCRAHGARYVIAVNLNFDICGRGTIVPHLEPDMSGEDLPEPHAGKNGSGVRGLLKRQVLGKSEATPGISTVMVEAFNIVQDRIARSRLAGDPPDAMINLRLSDMGQQLQQRDFVAAQGSGLSIAFQGLGAHVDDRVADAKTL